MFYKTQDSQKRHLVIRHADGTRILCAHIEILRDTFVRGSFVRNNQTKNFCIRQLGADYVALDITESGNNCPAFFSETPERALLNLFQIPFGMDLEEEGMIV